MPRKYDVSLISQIDINQKEVEFKNVPILMKPIPEGGLPGDMDPRLYKSMKMMPLMSHFLPKPKKNATTLEKILPLRKMFGTYKGDILVSQGISKQTVKIKSTDEHEVPTRIYKRQNAKQSLPIFVYYHGGGFFGGGLDIVEQMCMLIVQNIDCVVLSVDYRLCPEAHYPQPFDDCWYVTKWAYEHATELGADCTKLAVGGDSAGGNLAAAITLRDREEKTAMVKMQVLLYPAVNIARAKTEFYSGTDLSKYQSSKQHAKVLNSVVSMMMQLLNGDENMLEEVYLQGHLPKEDIYASPLLDDFHDLPDTLLIFGEHDMLVFEDIAYARTAHKAGVSLKTIIYRGIGHGFADQIGVAPQAEDCMNEIAKAIQTVLVDGEALSKTKPAKG